MFCSENSSLFGIVCIICSALEGEGDTDAVLPVTQHDDPLSGGHFTKGTSKAPLGKLIENVKKKGRTPTAYPGSARERSRVVIYIVVALNMAYGEHARTDVNRESPISNGLTAVAVADNQ